MPIEDKITNIENEVDAFAGRQSLFDCPGNLMILNLLRYLEFVTFLDKEKETKSNWINYGHSKICYNLRGVAHSIDWAYEYCSRFDSFDFRFDDKNLDKLKSIFFLSQKYDIVSDFFFYIRKGILKATYNDADKTILLNQSNQRIQLFKVINYYIATHHVEKMVDSNALNDKYDELIDRAISIVKKIKMKGNSEFFYLDYNISEMIDIYKIVIESNERLMHDFDEEWNIGEYKIKDFRLVFASIITIAIVHNIFLFSIYIQTKETINKNKLFQNLVPFYNKKKWINIINKFTNLSLETVGSIINDLTFDPLNQKNKNKIGVTLYCFYPISDSILALSNSIARNSYEERNIWLMLERKNRLVHSSLSNKKEEYWRKNIVSRLLKLGIWSHDKAINIGFTDIDLLIIDFQNSFGLSIELKWLTASNRAIDYSSSIDVELKKGQKQARQCEEWLIENKKELSKKIEVDYQKIKSIIFKSVVLSKNSIGSQEVNDDGDVPVISEDLFWWILESPTGKSIFDLYDKAKNKSFYPEIDKHFFIQDQQVDYAGYKFLQKDAYIPNNKWNYLADIK